MTKKKVFFACSMRGGQGVVDQEYLRQIPEVLKELGLELVSEHQTQEGIIQKEDELTPADIHDRDYTWIKDSDVLIAEISNPSLGVGGEISDAIPFGRPVLAIYQQAPNKVSAYARGKLDVYDKGYHVQYKSLDGLRDIVSGFMDEFLPEWRSE